MTYMIGRGGLSPARVLGAGLPLAGLLGLLVYGVLSSGEPLLLQAFEALSETATGRAAGLAAFMLINGGCVFGAPRRILLRCCGCAAPFLRWNARCQ